MLLSKSTEELHQRDSSSNQNHAVQIDTHHDHDRTEAAMRILETIAQTLRTERAHPTTVLNALIELENAGGISALYELEYRLARLVRAMRERDDHALPVAIGWLESSRAYLEEFGQIAPVPVTPVTIHSRVLKAVNIFQPQLRSA
jgi:hypothetical protein